VCGCGCASCGYGYGTGCGCGHSVAYGVGNVIVVLSHHWHGLPTNWLSATRDIESSIGIRPSLKVPREIPFIRKARPSNPTSRFPYLFCAGADRAGVIVDATRARTARFM
jgi:hypothetical protein